MEWESYGHLQEPQKPPQSLLLSSNSTSSNYSVPTIPLNFQEHEVRLDDNYVITDLDICSGRGKAFWNHSGNIMFRQLIQSKVSDYINAPSKADKSAIVSTIVDELRKKGCKFLRQQQDKGENGNNNKTMVWYDIGDSQARDKVGHSLRDHVTAIKKETTSPGTLSSTSSAGSKGPKLSVAVSGFSPPLVPNITTNIEEEENIIITEPSHQHPQQQQQYQQQQNYQHQQYQDHHQQQQQQPQYQHHRRPSLALSDGGNEVEMRRSTILLDTSELIYEFSRRPSWVAEVLNEIDIDNYDPNNDHDHHNDQDEKMMFDSQLSLPEYHTSHDRISIVVQNNQHQQPTNHNNSFASFNNNTMYNNKYDTALKQVAFRRSSRVLGGQQQIQQLRTSSNSHSTRGVASDDRIASLSSLDDTTVTGITGFEERYGDLMRSSIYSINTTAGGHNNPRNSIRFRNSIMRMSGMSTLRRSTVFNQNQRRRSTIRMSEFSLLSANFEDMNISSDDLEM